MVRGAGHRHHPGAIGTEQTREEMGGERPVAEMVDPELHLEAVLGAALRHRHDAGVVDQDVDGRTRLRHGVGRFPDRVE